MSKLPTEKTRRKWMTKHRWLNFTMEDKMVCKTCSWRAEKFDVQTTGKFVLGSKNYQLSSVKDHATTDPHAAAKSSKEVSDAKEAGMSVPPHKLILKTPSDSAIFRSL